MFQSKNKDVLQIVLSDMHSGSNYALFVEKEWKGLNNMSHFPRSDQIEIRQHFDRYANEVLERRKGKQVRMIINGDAIDGDHHQSGDVCTVNPLEQSNIHIQIMSEFQKRIDWQRGDEIYYVKGTQIHTGDWEDYIGNEMNAVPNGEYHAFESLDLETNGRLSRFVHHGPSGGDGANEGNAVRNWLKSFYFDAVKDGDRIPDIVYTAHVHNPTYSTYEWRKGMNFNVLHGVITPAWQLKTRYAWKRAPKAKNKIGGVIHEIKADGTIAVPRFCVMGYE